LADAAERGLSAVDAGARLAREEISPETGRVELSFLHLLGRSLVPSLLRSYSAQRPGVRFTLVQGSRQDMVDWLLAGELDLTLLARQPGRGGRSADQPAGAAHHRLGLAHRRAPPARGGRVPLARPRFPSPVKALHGCQSR